MSRACIYECGRGVVGQIAQPYLILSVTLPRHRSAVEIVQCQTVCRLDGGGGGDGDGDDDATALSVHGLTHSVAADSISDFILSQSRSATPQIWFLRLADVRSIKDALVIACTCRHGAGHRLASMTYDVSAMTRHVKSKFDKSVGNLGCCCCSIITLA